MTHMRFKEAVKMRHIPQQILAGGLLAVLLLWGSALAAEPEALLPIEPVPMIEISDYVTIALDPAPERFGFIDRINEECFVISDICRSFAPKAVFRTRRDGPATSRNAFRVGDFVGFRFNIKREVEAVWFEPVPAGLK